jgi:hypothetical protein
MRPIPIEEKLLSMRKNHDVQKLIKERCHLGSTVTSAFLVAVATLQLSFAADTVGRCIRDNLARAVANPIPAEKMQKLLSGSQTIEEFLQGELDTAAAYQKLKGLSNQADIDPTAAFDILVDEYMMKAGAGGALLREKLIAQVHDRTMIKNPRFRYLKAAFPGSTAPVLPQRDGYVPLSIFANDNKNRGNSANTILHTAVRTEGHTRAYPGGMYRTLSKLKKGEPLGNPRFPQFSSAPQLLSFLSDSLLRKNFLMRHGEARAIQSYAADGYLEINCVLRGSCVGQVPESSLQTIRSDIQSIRDVFTRMPGTRAEVALYRGASLTDESRIPSVGDVIEDSAFLSTSAEPKVAETYVFGVPGREYEGAKLDMREYDGQRLSWSDLHSHAKADKLPRRGVVYVYHLPEGSKALPLSYLLNFEKVPLNVGNTKTEFEVLLPDQLKFEVFQVDEPYEAKTWAQGEGGARVQVGNQVQRVHLRPISGSRTQER